MAFLTCVHNLNKLKLSFINVSWYYYIFLLVKFTLVLIRKKIIFEISYVYLMTLANALSEQVKKTHIRKKQTRLQASNNNKEAPHEKQP